MTSGVHNKMYEDDMTCIDESCDKKPLSNNMCSAHDWQFRKYGMTWPIGTPRPHRIKATDGFSTDRYCPKCHQTKDWTQYHLELGMCAQCHRALLKDDVPPESAGMEDLLKFIDKITKRNKRKGQQV